MGFFSKTYEPGGEHHIRITDSVFDEALTQLRTDSDVRTRYQKFAEDRGCRKYEAHDFPVTEMIGVFLLSYELQEERNGIPENQRMMTVELGRKDQVAYEKFVEKYRSRAESQAQYAQENWNRKGLGGKLFSLAANAAAQGIAKAATGKAEDVRMFEKEVSNYLCGDSMKAKDYLMKFATEFGGTDEGLIEVANAIREQFWIAEFAKYNRSK